ncbi:hypothetical protein IWX47DRAFT_558597 [Phyllosticta citricarpa]
MEDETRPDQTRREMTGSVSAANQLCQRHCDEPAVRVSGVFLSWRRRRSPSETDGIAGVGLVDKEKLFKERAAAVVFVRADVENRVRPSWRHLWAQLKEDALVYLPWVTPSRPDCPLLRIHMHPSILVDFPRSLLLAAHVHVQALVHGELLLALGHHVQLVALPTMHHAQALVGARVRVPGERHLANALFDGGLAGPDLVDRGREPRRLDAKGRGAGAVQDLQVVGEVESLLGALLLLLLQLIQLRLLQRLLDHSRPLLFKVPRRQLQTRDEPGEGSDDDQRDEAASALERERPWSFDSSWCFDATEGRLPDAELGCAQRFCNNCTCAGSDQYGFGTILELYLLSEPSEWVPSSLCLSCKPDSETVAAGAARERSG